MTNTEHTPNGGRTMRYCDALTYLTETLDREVEVVTTVPLNPTADAKLAGRNDGQIDVRVGNVRAATAHPVNK